jgi:hypothetical protein
MLLKGRFGAAGTQVLHGSLDRKGRRFFGRMIKRGTHSTPAMGLLSESGVSPIQFY